MVFNNNLLLGAAGQGGDYIIDQSLRFNDNDSAYLFNSSPSTGDSTKLATFSVWVKKGNLFTQTGRSSQTIFSQGANDGGNNYTVFYCGTTNLDDYFRWSMIEGGSATFDVKWGAQLRDPSAWYHFFTVLDTDQASSTDRIKLWVNGVQITDIVVGNWPTSGETTDLGTTQQMEVGRQNQNTGFLDGYLAEFHYLDGITGDVADFGKYNYDGVWVPKAYAGTYGTNGFYLDFADSSSLGTDVSGNGNNFTSSGLTSDDQVADTPTNNFCTWNPLNADSAFTFSQGNTLAEQDNVGAWRTALATIGVSSGKWVWEVKFEGGDPFGQWSSAGIAGDGKGPQDLSYISGPGFITFFYATSDSRIVVWDQSVTATTYATGVSSPGSGAIMFLLDVDSSTIELRTDNTSHGTYDISGLATPLIPFCNIYSGGTNDLTLVTNESDFTNTVPAGGYKTLNTANLPTPAIADGSAYFQTTLYTGNGTAIGSGGNAVSQIENSTFQPDFVWIKRRNAAVEHVLTDAVRGVTKELSSNDTGAEETVAEGLTTFGSSGFTVGSDGSYNTNTGTYAAWQWLAGNGTASNTDGSITSTVSANTTAGFSIVSFTGTGTAGATVGHGLGVEPDMIILKFLNTTSNWSIYHKELGNTKRLVFDTSTPTTSSAYWNNTSPTSSVFTLGTDLNQTYNHVVYCFASVEGFSKFGSYTGNGSSNGSCVWCGFRPAMVIIKRTSGGVGKWVLLDSARDLYNPTDAFLHPNETTAENQGGDVDFLSNGFKTRANDSWFNGAGSTYVFAAFAEHPFGGDGVVPVPAR